MQLEVEVLKLYDCMASDLELIVRDVLGVVSFTCYIPTSTGGGNPFGSPASFENSKPGMEFGEAKVGSNKLMQRKLSRECSMGKHHMLPPSVFLGFILYSRTWILVQLSVLRV